MFVNVSVDVSVTIEPSVAKETLSAVTVVVIPEPPSKVIVSPKSVSELPVSPAIVIVEFANFEFAIVSKALFGIFVKVLVVASIDLFQRTLVEVVVM